MKYRGNVWKFGNNISTDQIIPGSYFNLRHNPGKLVKHVFEDIEENFFEKIKPGDIIVAGKNFGQGSSREHAPLAIKLSGISIIIAKSFARIFYRNSINIGLPLVVCNTNNIDRSDKIKVDTKNNILFNLSKDIKIKTEQIPEFCANILNEGGLIPYINKYKKLIL